MSDLTDRLRRVATMRYADGHPDIRGPLVEDAAADLIDQQALVIRELVEALEQALTHIEVDETTHGRNFAAGNVARAAIAKTLP